MIPLNWSLINRRSTVVPLLLLALLVPDRAWSQSATSERKQSDPAVGHYFQLIRDEFSGERAYQIVAFMDNHWRLPGNSGFNASIRRVESELLEAGYRPEESPGDHPFTYRIEYRPMRQPAWEPLEASLTVVGEEKPLLDFTSNRNMLAIYSFSTPPEGVEGEVVYVGRGSADDFEGLDVRGKIVFGEASSGRLFREAVQNRGALGILSYSIPGYNRPEIYRHSIQFSSILYDPELESWGIRLSLAACERLKEVLERGEVRVCVKVRSHIHESEELTIVADVHGKEVPEERFVFSAHIQEPGANDNASGVAVQAEMACVLARLIQEGMPLPRRSITFLWGDEIISTRRYLQDDPARTEGVRWGISLDMVGEKTSVTGGTFLIEKMPDPSAVWTRGEDQHTEWGGRPLGEDRMTPHYFNDFVLARCLDQASLSRWIVKTNPYEGGSDHVPFLNAGKPGLLLWHFTDYFYHTDGDRLDKVSAATMRNVGVSALCCALLLASADGGTARAIIEEVAAMAIDRLNTEFELSRAAIAEGGDIDEQAHILSAWRDWYVEAIRKAEDIEVGGSSGETRLAIEVSALKVQEHGTTLIDKLRSAAYSYYYH